MIIKAALIWGGVTVVFLAEIFTYWKIRYFRIRKGLVWLHLFGWIFFVLVLPILNVALKVWLRTHLNSAGIHNTARTLNLVLAGLVWGVLIIGHLCFAIVLVDAYKKKQHPEADIPDDAGHFLNDYKP